MKGPARVKVDVRLPGKGNSNPHGARPVHLIIKMIKWIRTSRLSIKNSLSPARVPNAAGAPAETCQVTNTNLLNGSARRVRPARLQGYLAHKKQRTPRTLQQDYAECPMLVLGAGSRPMPDAAVAPQTPHPKPYIIPKPYALYPTPYTLHPSPYTPQPTPYSLHPKLYTPPSAVERSRHTQDSQGQIMALSFRRKPVKPFKLLFPFRSAAVERTAARGKGVA